MSNHMQTLETSIMSLQDEFVKVAVDPNINFKAEANFALQALNNNNYLYQIACGNAQSLYDAVTNISAIGISLNPASKQAYLVRHDLRHTWASWLVQSGVPLLELKEMGGWESVEMVQKYAHLASEHLHKNAVFVDRVGQGAECHVTNLSHESRAQKNTLVSMLGGVN